MNKLLKQAFDPATICGRDNSIHVDIDNDCITYEAIYGTFFSIDTRPLYIGQPPKISTEAARREGTSYRLGIDSDGEIHLSLGKSLNLNMILNRCDVWAHSYAVYKNSGYFPNGRGAEFSHA
ncbi:hypothetical protein [Maridesulfovibrio sp.]|uniref:hypothetical protein n=1 Tax=Maridesulfovibrio sp. TaxID=2795000 RepID=UPI0039F08035